MTASPARKTIATIAALASLAIAACSPPHQIDSDQKIDTATSQDPKAVASSGYTGSAATTSVTKAAPASSAQAAEQNAARTPQLNNCGEKGLTRPTALNLDCKDNKERLEDVVWDSWDADGAKGTATRITVDPDRRIEGAQVSLGNPEEVDGNLVFTVISVDGNTVVPESGY